ncbi:hypothetical protein DEA98_25660 [Brucella pseudogrignonensis]|nr:hypothetical protein [Brucella pseudogrignonensis]
MRLVLQREFCGLVAEADGFRPIAALRDLSGAAFSNRFIAAAISPASPCSRASDRQVLAGALSKRQPFRPPAPGIVVGFDRGGDCSLVLANSNEANA